MILILSESSEAKTKMRIPMTPLNTRPIHPPAATLPPSSSPPAIFHMAGWMCGWGRSHIFFHSDSGRERVWIIHNSACRGAPLDAVWPCVDDGWERNISLLARWPIWPIAIPIRPSITSLRIFIIFVYALRRSFCVVEFSSGPVPINAYYTTIILWCRVHRRHRHTTSSPVSRNHRHRRFPIGSHTDEIHSFWSNLSGRQAPFRASEANG